MELPDEQLDTRMIKKFRPQPDNCLDKRRKSNKSKKEKSKYSSKYVLTELLE